VRTTYGSEVFGEHVPAASAEAGVRLERAGWVEAEWEDIDPVAEGRPSRKYYRLTRLGVTHSRQELAALRQQLSRVAGVLGPIGEARS